MNTSSIIRNYLLKKSRVPRLPEGLLQAIHEWAAPIYRSNLIAVYGNNTNPVSYQRMFPVKPMDYVKLDRTKINVRIVPEEKDQEATYDERQNTIFIYLPLLSEDTQANIHDKLNVLEQDLYYKIYHELIHFVQFRTKERVGGETKLFRDYYNHEDDYFISPIEYKSNLISAVGDFKYDFYKKDYTLQDIKEYIGPNSSIRYFKSLYHRAPSRWKKAVKDFYTMISQDIL